MVPHVDTKTLLSELHQRHRRRPCNGSLTHAAEGRKATPGATLGGRERPPSTRRTGLGRQRAVGVERRDRRMIPPAGMPSWLRPYRAYAPGEVGEPENLAFPRPQPIVTVRRIQLIVLGLVTPTREWAMTNAYLLSGDEDIREESSRLSRWGLQVVLLGVPSADRPNHSEPFRREVDGYIGSTGRRSSSQVLRHEYRSHQGLWPSHPRTEIGRQFGEEWVTREPDPEIETIREQAPASPRNSTLNHARRREVARRLALCARAGDLQSTCALSHYVRLPTSGHVALEVACQDRTKASSNVSLQPAPPGALPPTTSDSPPAPMISRSSEAFDRRPLTTAELGWQKPDRLNLLPDRIHRPPPDPLVPAATCPIRDPPV